ncbi:unnamed protein product [Periconia digitata]|uniref:Uncharacterized protein n=1 Tax=Periconia digitata TaxID=1303443 RepID=A0A9W4UBL1_9PLEO|nr:unnamed protein product [Periconia digitata]
MMRMRSRQYTSFCFRGFVTVTSQTSSGSRDTPMWKAMRNVTCSRNGPQSDINRLDPYSRELIFFEDFSKKIRAEDAKRQRMGELEEGEIDESLDDSSDVSLEELPSTSHDEHLQGNHDELPNNSGDGERPDDERSDNERPDNERPDGESPEDKHPEDKHPKDKHPKDKHPKDKHPKDKHPKDKHPKDKRSDNERSDNERSNDERSNDERSNDEPDDQPANSDSGAESQPHSPRLSRKNVEFSNTHDSSFYNIDAAPNEFRRNAPRKLDPADYWDHKHDCWFACAAG